MKACADARMEFALPLTNGELDDLLALIERKISELES